MLKQAFIEGMSRAAASVSIVTTAGEGGREGVTVSAMTSVSADPGSPQLLVCMHHEGRTAQAICKNRLFCVNVLREEHVYLADQFAGRSKDDTVSRFASEAWVTLKTGAPVAVDALVSFDCTLTEALRRGSHWIFVGEVLAVSLGEHKSPLIYANRGYRNLKDDARLRQWPTDGDGAAYRPTHCS